MARELAKRSRTVVTRTVAGLALSSAVVGLHWTAAAQEDAADATRIGDMVVTASRVEESPETIPANVTVIAAEQIENSLARTVPDVLKYEAGVHVADWTGTGRAASVDIRGFGEAASANTLVLVDGRRINAPDLSGVDWTTIPLERIERIEIIRGGGSVMYGDNATAGVINIITKRGAPRHQVSAGVEIGTYRYAKGWMSAAGGTGPWSYGATASYTDTDGYRDNGFFRNATGGLSLNYDPEGVFGASFSAGYKDDKYGLPGAIPVGQNRKSTNFPDAYADTEEGYARLVPRLDFGAAGTFSLALDYRDYHQYTEFFGPYEYSLEEYGIAPKYVNTFETGRLVHDIVVGIDYYNSDFTYEQGFLDGERHRYEVGYYAHDKIALIPDRLFLALGYRRARTKYRMSELDDAAFSTDAATVGLTYAYAPESKLFAAFDRAYRTVRLDELGGAFFGDILPPQISKHYQAGIRHRFGDWLTAAVTVFQIDTRDEIFFDPFVTPGPWGWGGENVNYEKTRRRGIELQLESQPHERLRLFANYTWMDPELKGDKYDGNQIPGTARHSGSLGATVFATDRLTFDARARWTDDRVMISDWENVIDHDWKDDYVVVDVMVKYDLAPISVYAGVNNLFDEKYSEYAVYDTFMAQRTIYPSPARNVIAGVVYTLEF